MHLQFAYDFDYYKSPDWNVYFRMDADGHVYMPLDATMSAPIGYHYYRRSYDHHESTTHRDVIALLADQWLMVPEYLGRESMLALPEREGARLGIISSRDLPALQQLQDENENYANWRIGIPPTGGPIVVYYAAIPVLADQTKAYAFLNALLEPEVQAATAMRSGYLPAVRAANDHLEGLAHTAYPFGLWDTCLIVKRDQEQRFYFEQVMRNALYTLAEHNPVANLTSIEVYYETDGLVSEAHRLDLLEFTYSAFWPEQAQPASRVVFTQEADFTSTYARVFRQGAHRVGMPYWKEHLDGAPGWRVVMTFADDSTKTCQGGELPLTWQEMSMLALDLCNKEIFHAPN